MTSFLRSATDSLRKLNIVQRKCLFNDESIQELPVYSYQACILVCRAQAALRLCNCRPYYYPFMNGTSCSPAGLLCLAINKWPQSAGNCVCAKTCVEIVYTQNSLKKINWWGFSGDIWKEVFSQILLTFQGRWWRNSICTEVIISLWDHCTSNAPSKRRSLQSWWSSCLIRRCHSAFSGL